MAIQDRMLSPRDNLGYYRNSNILAKHLYLGNTWYSVTEHQNKIWKDSAFFQGTKMIPLDVAKERISNSA